jgi:hypothetical protein
LILNWEYFSQPLIIGELRDLPWNIGIMEYWNDGLKGEKTNRSMPFDFTTQYSAISSFHWGIGGFLFPGLVRIGI